MSLFGQGQCTYFCGCCDLFLLWGISYVATILSLTKDTKYIANYGKSIEYFVSVVLMIPHKPLLDLSSTFLQNEKIL